MLSKTSLTKNKLVVLIGFLYTDSMKIKNTLTLVRNLKKGEGFTRLISPAKVALDIKEAKRVGYLVEKDDMSFYINDDETGELVMNGIRVNRSFYACAFNRLYWEEPSIDLTANELEEKRITKEQLDSACNS